MEDKYLKNRNEYKVEITTGQYETAPLEQKSMVQNLFGKHVEYDFEIYFHWYNIAYQKLLSKLLIKGAFFATQI